MTHGEKDALVVGMGLGMILTLLIGLWALNQVRQANAAIAAEIGCRDTVTVAVDSRGGWVSCPPGTDYEAMYPEIASPRP